MLFCRLKKTNRSKHDKIYDTNVRSSHSAHRVYPLFLWEILGFKKDEMDYKMCATNAIGFDSESGSSISGHLLFLSQPKMNLFLPRTMTMAKWF